ncbi:hypothetical protein [Streptomyces californicus]|uniref:hypothetical protein n=1 Tax=Streptomyces californicus TaxID=67351 RepID=UPI0037B2667A
MRISPAPPLFSRSGGPSPQPRPDGLRSGAGPGPAATRRRPGALRRRWARTRQRARTLAALEWTSCALPDGTGEHQLLLVHHRKVVGEISYRLCAHCPAGQLTTTRIGTPLPERSLARRVLSHLRFRHPDRTWLPSAASARTRGNRRGRAAGPGICPGHAEARHSFSGQGAGAAADGRAAARP